MTAQQTWTVKDTLTWMTSYLESHGDTHPRRSAEYLLCAATGLSRVGVYAFFDRPLSEEERTVLRTGVARRAAGEPLQYVVGETAFRHIVITVDPSVLIPRPETEVLVDHLLTRIDACPNPEPVVLDIGTGSGCIALSVAAERPQSRVIATDISPEALACAAANAQRLGLADRVTFLAGDLAAPALAALKGSIPCALVSNPPYIPSSALAALDREVVGFEPTLALDGGPDGLDAYRALMAQVVPYASAHGAFDVLLELDERNVAQAAADALEYGIYRRVDVEPDLAQRRRFLLAYAR